LSNSSRSKKRRSRGENEGRRSRDEARLYQKEVHRIRGNHEIGRTTGGIAEDGGPIPLGGTINGADGHSNYAAVAEKYAAVA
jgi:hypothetical protein